MTKHLHLKPRLLALIVALSMGASGTGLFAQDITFADTNVKAICVAHWDTSGDGNLSYDEAAVVTSIGTVFKGNTTITKFNELQYFTSLTSLSRASFLWLYRIDPSDHSRQCDFDRQPSLLELSSFGNSQFQCGELH